MFFPAPFFSFDHPATRYATVDGVEIFQGHITTLAETVAHPFKIHAVFTVGHLTPSFPDLSLVFLLRPPEFQTEL